MTLFFRNSIEILQFVVIISVEIIARITLQRTPNYQNLSLLDDSNQSNCIQYPLFGLASSALLVTVFLILRPSFLVTRSTIDD